MSQCAREHGVNYSTLRRRIEKIHQPHSVAHESQCYLTVGQEASLIDFAIYNASTGHPNGVNTIRYTAQAIAKKDKAPSKKWVRNFRKRHPDIVSAKPAPLDPKRAKAFNRTIVENHFELLRKFMEERGIEWRDVWNMDEKGIQLGGGRKNNGRKYLFSRHQRNRIRLKDENLELVTIIECVRATGGCIRPGFIFSGKKHCPDWYKGGPCS